MPVISVLTQNNDVVLPDDADQIVQATIETLQGGVLDRKPDGSYDYTGGDQLDGGAGYDVLALSGRGIFSLKHLGQFKGFEEVTFTNTTGSSAGLILRPGSDLIVRLSDGTPGIAATSDDSGRQAADCAVYLTSGRITLYGGNEDDHIFAGEPSDRIAGDIIDGGSGNNGLSFSYSYAPVSGANSSGIAVYEDSVYDLTSISLRHVQNLSVAGNAAAAYTGTENLFDPASFGTNTIVKVDTASLSDVRAITMNNGAKLVTAASSLDLTGKTVEGGVIESQNIGGTTFTVDNAATALLMQGGGSEQDSLVVEGQTLSREQRDQIFAHSIESITDQSGSFEKSTAKPLTTVDDTASVPVGGTASGTAGTAGTGVLAGDGTPNGGALFVSALSGGTLGSPLAGTYGHLTLQADGSYRYVADNVAAVSKAQAVAGTFNTVVLAGTSADAAAMNAAAATLPLHDVFTYTVSDTFGASASSTLDLAVTAAEPALPDSTVTLTSSDGATVTVKTDARGMMVSNKTAYLDGSSDSFAYTVNSRGGVLTTETVIHADKFKEVYQHNLGDPSFSVAHTAYDAAGKVTEYDQRTTDGALHRQTLYNADGSVETKLFSAGGVLATGTLVHADKSKEVYQHNLGDPSFSVAHTTYDAAGKVTGYEQRTADGALHRQTLYNADGSTETKLFSSGGALATDTLVHADRSKEVFQHDLGSPSFSVAHTTYDAAGHVSAFDQRLADGSLHYQSLYAEDGARVSTSYGITGQSYTTRAVGYDAGGTATRVDLTHVDGSHSQSALVAGQTLTSTVTVADHFVSVGADAFTFVSGFGRDDVTRFHAGSGADHDVLRLDASAVANYAALQGHLAASGSDTVVTVSATDTIVLHGIAPGSLTADNFAFIDHLAHVG